MEDKELVEVWQSEFESLMAETFSHRSLEKESGHYIDRDVFYWFAGFIMAKRSQPSVDMSLGQIVVLSNFDRGYNKAIADACIRLTAAGIKYTIGE